MISGRLGVWQLLVLLPPAIAAVQLLLPFAYRVRPAQLGRRAAGFAGVWAVFVFVALVEPRIAEAVRGALGADRPFAADSPIFTAVFAVIMAGMIVSASVTVVGACRREVRMRPVAQAELPVLRPLAASAVRADDDWAVQAVDLAEEELRNGRGAQAVSLLRSAAVALCETGLDAADGRAAAEVRDRLAVAGQSAGGS
ncbi:hypothetical protein ABZ896_19935 [Streptomyces sp. NPDC047072]|uniref:hypothetical protein n=1 Tax=Streptomyces sp. NPDC047072 TaxID=3154809 RepID=UPI0033EE888A